MYRLKNIITTAVCICCLLASQWRLALGDDLPLPKPGMIVQESPAFSPLVLRGIKVHPENPFQLDFVIDKGDSQDNDVQLRNDATVLVKYFLAALTIPEKELWVNLSPYEGKRIIPESFGLTQMGRDMLAQDYMLKEVTSSLIYPEDRVGKRFWKRIYEAASKKYGTTDIPVNTFNKVWIVPEKALVYEDARSGTAYVVKSQLRVLLEEDYLALQKEGKVREKNENALGAQIVRTVIIPELNREVNEGKNFSKLRQIFQSLILAAWYKKKIKEDILSQVYINQHKISGINLEDHLSKEKIYQRYLMAFKKGTYNYIKEETDPLTQKTVVRKYFSGGVVAAPLFAVDGAMTIFQQPPVGWRVGAQWILAGVSLVALPVWAGQEGEPQTNGATATPVRVKVNDLYELHTIALPGSTNRVFIRGIHHSTQQADDFLLRMIFNTPTVQLETVLSQVVQNSLFTQVLTNYNTVIEDVRRLNQSGQLEVWALEDRFALTDISADMKNKERELAGLQSRLAYVNPELRDKVLLLYLGPAYYLDIKGEMPHSIVSVEHTYLSMKQDVLNQRIRPLIRDLKAMVGDNEFTQFMGMMFSNGRFLNADAQKIQEVIGSFQEPQARGKAEEIAAVHKQLKQTDDLRTQWMGYRLSHESNSVYFTPGIAHIPSFLNSLNTVQPEIEGTQVMEDVQKMVAESIIGKLSGSPVFEGWHQAEDKAGKLIIFGGKEGKITFHLSREQRAMNIDIEGRDITAHVKSALEEGKFDQYYPSAQGLNLYIPEALYYKAIERQVEGNFHTAVSDGDHAGLSAAKEKDLGGINFDISQLDLQVQQGHVAMRWSIDPVFFKELSDSPGFVPVITDMKAISESLTRQH